MDINDELHHWDNKGCGFLRSEGPMRSYDVCGLTYLRNVVALQVACTSVRVFELLKIVCLCRERVRVFRLCVREKKEDE